MRYDKKRLLVVFFIVFGIVALINTRFTPIFYYNTTASIPKGIYYATEYDGTVTKGDIVVFRPPKEVASYGVERKYLAPGVDMMKYVAAVHGEKVRVAIDGFYAGGEYYGHIDDVDSTGRELIPWPYGDEYIVPDGLFIAVGSHAKSWDSRFYGPIPIDRIITKVRPLLIFEN